MTHHRACAVEMGHNACTCPAFGPEDALTPEEARVIIDAGYDPERILAFLFGEADG